MPRLNSIPLSRKLPIFIVGFSILLAAGLISASLLALQKYAFTAVENQMFSMISDRRFAVRQMLKGVEADLESLAVSSATANALADFEESWGALGGDAQSELTQAYIDGNPNAVGSKHLLDRAQGDAAYHSDHALYHPGLRTLIETKGYYDAFLINPAGDIVYSVFKEVDYATNLVSGAYKDSGLADVFQSALKGADGSMHFDDMRPYAPSFGAAAAFIASPVRDADNALLGVVALQIPVNMMGEITNSSLGLGESTQIYIVGEDGLARTTSRFDSGFQVLDQLPMTHHIEEALAGHSVFEVDEGVNGQQVVTYVKPLELDYANWAIIAEQDVSETMGPVWAQGQILIAVSVLLTSVLSVFGWMFARSITRPLSEICGDMEQISGGDFDTDVATAERGDEIGNLGKTLVAMRGDLKKAKDAEAQRAIAAREQEVVVEKLSAGLGQLSNGDFARTIEEPFGSEHDALRQDFNKTVHQLNATVSQVVESADSIKSGAAEISQSSQDLSQRTENQAATLEETAAALKEMTSNVQAAAEGTRNVESVVSEARSEAEVSGEVVRDAVSAMTEIEEGSRHISQIIGVIDDIAFQTNLLALNAGVEAARAGDAGRGFAVVASEVRALALKSSDAASEIKELISASTQQVESGVVLVGKAGEALTSITERVNNISSLVSEIARSATDQSAGLAEINSSVVQLDQVTQANAAMVEEATAAGQMLAKDASELMAMVSSFKTDATLVDETPEVASAPSSPAPEPQVAPTQDAPKPAPKRPAPPMAVQGNAAVDMDLWQDF
ncbi:MAG: HAMP domain-containing protein [Shimia sp.]|uniref:methyl-accepting chemotaxis protein n=1 Tax=Shimia sp. TaxID=1954381 RepID=UPI001B2BC554|nr:methyl-accepting chemotaxis protein [Shimia sp.]MBO6897588.1 HAMP domain-containing protein [Shimia sp.]